MKIKDFLYIITIFVTAILAMMNSCNGGKLKKDYSNLLKDYTQVEQTAANLSVQLDSVKAIPPDTVVEYKTRIVTKTRILPMYDTAFVTNIDTIRYDTITQYTFSEYKNGVAIVDTIDVRGELVSHKQDVVVTDTVKTIYIKEPVIVEKEVIKEVPRKSRLEVWAGTTVNGNFRFDPVLGFQYKGFGTHIIKPITPTFQDVQLLFSTKIRFR
ncbi:MAG: hypothetical protein IPN33_25485 [Saprospiraceae bacterium]|nr:hypothetical protein [Saprospiraceae bacterium]